MGAIHGKGRFKCDGCNHRFSWRLDLRDHVKSCKPQIFRNGGHQQQSEIYLLDDCFLCGQHLVGTHSEEASFIKGNQKLYHSNKPLAEVLEVITCDTSLASQNNHTIALCKHCMNSVNKWDETHQQLRDIASSLRKTYRSWHHKKRSKLLVSKYPDSLRECNIALEKSSKEVEGDIISEETSFQSSPRFITGEQENNESQCIEKSSENAAKDYACRCGKVVHSLDELVEHQLRKGCKAKTSEYPCSYCNSVFAERKLLIAHKKACVKKSLVNGAHECDICGRRFLVRGRVETHKRTVHGIGTADQQLCSYCGRTFSSCYNMKYHYAREHGIGRVKLAVTCNLCGKKFSENSSYQSHVKNKHLDHRFECEHCGKKYATRGMRNHHINEMHNSSYSYKCSICGEEFKLIFRLRYHIRKMHSSVHHACKDCGKTFVMSSDLYRHIRGVHMHIRDRKRYPCKVCGRMFPSMYKVKRHATGHGIIESKERRNSSESKAKTSLDVQVKATEQVDPLFVQDENFVTDSLVKGMATTTVIHRKLETITSSLTEAAAAAVNVSEPSIATSLSETRMESADGTSIDVHQLPSAEIYTSPHITTLTPEILQGNMSAEVVAAETMAVGSVSSIVVSASAVQECINADDLQSAQQQQQLHEQNSLNLSHHLRRGSTLIQPALQSSLVPMHQMIVFEESVTEPGHNAFSVRSSNQVISVSQCTNQVISGSQIPSQVICIPHSNSETSPTSHHSQATFSVPLTTQHHQQVLGQQKLPTIQYEHYTS